MLKRSIAVGMLLLTCGWAAWLFGSVDWAGAQKERTDVDYSTDTALIAMTDSIEKTETNMKSYLQEIERTKADALPTTSSSASRKSRDIFGGTRRSALSDDGLEVIHVESDLPAQKAKPTFPVERYKLAGVMLGPDPRAFVLDTVESRTLSLRINDKIADGIIKTILSDEVVITGKFGTAKLRK